MLLLIISIINILIVIIYFSTILLSIINFVMVIFIMLFFDRKKILVEWMRIEDNCLRFEIYNFD